MVDYDALLRPGFSARADAPGVIEANFRREFAEALMDFEAAKAQFGELLGHPKLRRIISAAVDRMEAIWPSAARVLATRR